MLLSDPFRTTTGTAHIRTIRVVGSGAPHSMTNRKTLESTTRIGTMRMLGTLATMLGLAANLSASAQVMDQRQSLSGGQDPPGMRVIKGNEFPKARFNTYSPGQRVLLRSGGRSTGGSAPASGGLKGIIAQAQQADVQGNARKASELYWQAARTFARSGGAGLGVSEMNLLSASAGQAIVAVEKAQKSGKDAEAVAVMRESEPVFRRLGRLDWNNPEWSYRLGVILVNVDKRYDEARRQFSQTLTIAGGSELYRKKARKKLEQLGHAEQGFGMSGVQLRRW